jgi:hypothetical protein
LERTYIGFEPSRTRTCDPLVKSLLASVARGVKSAHLRDSFRKLA